MVSWRGVDGWVGGWVGLGCTVLGQPRLRVGVDVLFALAKGVEVFGAADEDHAKAMLLEVIDQLQAVPLVEAWLGLG